MFKVLVIDPSTQLAEEEEKNQGHSSSVRIPPYHQYRSGRLKHRHIPAGRPCVVVRLEIESARAVPEARLSSRLRLHPLMFRGLKAPSSWDLERD